MKDIDRKTVLAMTSRQSKWATRLVGRLLTPVELERVAGGGGSCHGADGHNQGGGGQFTQSGGSFNQNGGGGYNMRCTN